jgi:hypothetical protein
MNNFMMINGKKIEISQESADNLEREFAPKSKRQIFIDKWVGTQLPHGLSDQVVKETTVNGERFLLLTLPGANTERTLGAWKLAKQIINDAKNQNIHAYPQHYTLEGIDTRRNVVINVC